MDVKAAAQNPMKMTEIGEIPEDWATLPLQDLAEIRSGGTPSTRDNSLWDGDVPWITPTDITRLGGKKKIVETERTISEKGLKQSSADLIPVGSIILTTRATIGEAAINSKPMATNQGFKNLVPKQRVDNEFLYYLLLTKKPDMLALCAGSTFLEISKSQLSGILVQCPARLEEQKAIAEALSDADDYIRGLEKLVDKKRAIKQGAMQELLTGRRRLPGFDGEWQLVCLERFAECLDNLRVPLNEKQRRNMQGNIPYCGANGIVDWVDDYVIDQPIILIAEDGGHFDEFATRPIAYRMYGKAWVNNHAHILLARDGFSQDFIFYSLVHLDIRSFLASGTRAKLTKTEMMKITVEMPSDQEEQLAIAAVLNGMDDEIATLETQLDKAKQIKQAMMQELLTGRIRLV